MHIHIYMYIYETKKHIYDNNVIMSLWLRPSRLAPTCGGPQGLCRWGLEVKVEVNRPVKFISLQKSENGKAPNLPAWPGWVPLATERGANGWPSLKMARTLKATSDMICVPLFVSLPGPRGRADHKTQNLT